LLISPYIAGTGVREYYYTNCVDNSACGDATGE